MSTVTVNKNGVTQTNFEFSESDPTLLDALQNRGIEVLYHCREGFCGACRCKLVKGSVSYLNEPLAYVRDGEMLTCCSRPNEDIEIELI